MGSISNFKIKIFQLKPSEWLNLVECQKTIGVHKSKIIAYL